VDLDGTLIKVDSLHEAFVQLSAKQPLSALRALLMLKSGRASFKAAVADRVILDPPAFPFDEKVLAAINEARAKGRKIYLATAANELFASAIANSIGHIDGIFASDGKTNLKGQAKAERLIEAFGAHGFDYIGNSTADLHVWRAARMVLVTGAPAKLVGQLTREQLAPKILRARAPAAMAYFEALRPHQWLKNTLLFLPALAGHAFSGQALIPVLIAFASFCFGASSIYLINDMVDLPHDRAHPEKRHRPFAAGIVPVSHGAILFLFTAALSLALAMLLPSAFLVALAGYSALSLSYSLYLKRKLMVDVVALAALYGIRVLAGSAVTGIVLSQWLVGFCFFIFLSLALMKRTTEILQLPEESENNIKGRGYRRTDLPVLIALMAASGFVAVLVLALYINSPDVTTLYLRPDLLWGICIALVYWLGRAFFLTGRGEMRQDPVIFAATDRNSLLTGLVIVLLFLAAI
jgi:4-hydroxybenzoate polyprenyltransferase/phosphoserine phosphatase